jgi:hypothetical protein
MGAVALAGRLHAVGGRLTTFQFNVASYAVYDPTADRWSTQAPLPTPRSGIAAAVLDGWIFVVGGVFAHNDADDPEADTWVAMAPMRTPRRGTGAASLGGPLRPGGGLVTGGSRPSTAHETFVLASGPGPRRLPGRAASRPHRAVRQATGTSRSKKETAHLRREDT